MSEFEYASVIVSIVLALGIAEILRFLADTLREPRARELYWVHLLWIILLLELMVEFWWRMWEFQEQIAVGPQLALVLLGPAVLFMATRMILPRPGDEPDMARLYFRHKNAFFSIMVVTSLWSIAYSLRSFPDEQRHLIYVSLALNAVIMAAFIACILSSRRDLHAAVVLVILLMKLIHILGWVF